ncbi:MAG: hypothetical protein HY337_00270 [Gemmatimonadetes bacterium]|nr:hypothetical protein [Gemmatimonadota bacterium]
MTQSSLHRRAQPACLFAAVLAFAAVPDDSHAQTRLQVSRSERFRLAPSETARVLGTVAEGAEVTVGSERGGFTEVTLEGWVWARSVSRSGAREGFDLAVNAASGENLRARPNGAVLARLATGFLLQEVGRDDDWVRVRRTGWIASGGLKPTGGAPLAPAPAANAGAAVPSTGGAPSLDRGVTAGAVDLLTVPDGAASGRLAAGASVRVLARSGDWIRVETEGWIRESDLRPSAQGVLLGVSAAEVTARPREFEGKLVQWTVQYISQQTADELRPELPLGARYMLARGPLPESGFVYVVLEPAQAQFVDQLQPLAEVVMLARIRAGRMRYLYTPVVDAIELSLRQP